MIIWVLLGIPILFWLSSRRRIIWHRQWGIPSGQRPFCGSPKLEEQLAEYTGRPRALLFSTGYMANIGAINALIGRRDLVLQDQLNHASLLDGGRLSQADFKRYKHVDMASLEQRLEQSSAERKLIVTDGVFSMDGNLGTAARDQQLGEKHSAWLMVDDAHGVGVLGQQGGGLVEELNMSVEQVPVLVGTLGKSFGTFGAFVAGSEALIETLIQYSRSYIYTTALPPAIAAATIASLKIVREETWRRDKLGAASGAFSHVALSRSVCSWRNPIRLYSQC